MKTESLLWIIGGFLMMLPSIIGNDRTELVPIGIVFIVIGISVNKKNVEAEESESQ